MTANGGGRRFAPCRFCGRGPRPGLPRVPGRDGPICLDCVQAGLWLVHDGEARASAGGPALIRLPASDDAACQDCGRRERRTFLGRHRPLARMHSDSGAVICADCLDEAGTAINLAARH